jgi:hypothetical protein
MSSLTPAQLLLLLDAGSVNLLVLKPLNAKRLFEVCLNSQLFLHVFH